MFSHNFLFRLVRLKCKIILPGTHVYAHHSLIGIWIQNGRKKRNWEKGETRRANRPINFPLKSSHFQIIALRTQHSFACGQSTVGATIATNINTSITSPFGQYACCWFISICTVLDAARHLFGLFEIRCQRMLLENDVRLLFAVRWVAFVSNYKFASETHTTTQLHALSTCLQILLPNANAIDVWRCPTHNTQKLCGCAFALFSFCRLYTFGTESNSALGTKSQFIKTIIIFIAFNERSTISAYAFTWPPSSAATIVDKWSSIGTI